MASYPVWCRTNERAEKRLAWNDVFFVGMSGRHYPCNHVASRAGYRGAVRGRVSETAIQRFIALLTVAHAIWLAIVAAAMTPPRQEEPRTEGPTDSARTTPDSDRS